MTRPENPNPAPWQTVHPTTPIQVLSDSQDFVPLGQQFLRAGLITQSQLAQALREQRENFMKFGEVCLIHQWVSVEDLYRHTASHLLSLGEILIALGYIDINQLKLALSQQRRFGRKLGEILLWKAWVTEDNLLYALRVQQSMRQAALPDAWEALQSYLKEHPLHPSQEIPIPPPPEAEASLPPPPAVAATPVSLPDPPESHTHSTLNRIPSSGSQDVIDNEKLRGQVTTYRNKIASLELQLATQQQDWDAYSGQMAQQVADYQAQYEERIQQMEQLIQRSQAEMADLLQLRQQVEQLQTELELFQGYEQKYQLLLKQQQTQTQDLTQARFKIQQLEGDLRLSQVTLQDTERTLQQQQALVQQHEEQRQRLKQWEGEMRRARRIEQEYQQLQQQHALLQQEMDLLRSQVHTWEENAREQQYLLRERETLAHTIDQLQAQVTQQQYQLDDLHTERQTLQQQVESLRVVTPNGSAPPPTTHSTTVNPSVEQELQALRQHLQYVEAERDALAQQLTALPSMGRGDLASKLSQSQELVGAYRRSLEAVQKELEEQKQENRCLQARIEQQEAVLDVARIELRAPDSLSRRLQARLDAERAGQTPDQALHWADRILISLRDAALLTEQQRKTIAEIWKQQGGELTKVIYDQTGLDPQTIKFFSDEGYLARLLGCRRIGEYLRAAGLVSEADVEEALSMVPPGTRLGEALAKKGVLSPATADYFATHFTKDGKGKDS
ncbi:MAG: hypothetical protein OHK0012_24890 [Synechococcales cyanobacterium]